MTSKKFPDSWSKNQMKVSSSGGQRVIIVASKKQSSKIKDIDKELGVKHPDVTDLQKHIEVQSVAANAAVAHVTSDQERERISDAMKQLASQVENHDLLRLFLTNFNNLYPLISSAEKQKESPDKIRDIVLGHFKKYLEIQHQACEEFSIEHDYSKPLLRKLSLSISKLVGESLIKNKSDWDKVKIGLTSNNDQLNDVKDIFLSTPSDDILVNVKLALFPEAVKLTNLLESMKVAEESIKNIVRNHHNISVDMAKDVSFNWDKNAVFRDRETLFENVLPVCSEITTSIILSMVDTDNNLNYILLSKENYVNHLPKLKQAIFENDMGYSHHEELNMAYLTNELFDIVITYLFPAFKGKDYINAHNLILLELDDILTKSWFLASEVLISLINKMSEEEQNKWAESEGSKPMSLAYVAKEIKEFSFDFMKNKVPLTINIEELTTQTSKRLALLWGFSDAVCKIKKD